MTAMATATRPETSFQRLASVFLVDRIEPSLEFWVDRLGFEVRFQIRDEDRLEFAILGRDGVELIFRTRESVQMDAPGLSEMESENSSVMIHLDVDRLDEILPRLDGVEVLVPERETILGNSEVILREPSGRIVALSSRA